MQRPDLAILAAGQRLGVPTERATSLGVSTGPRGLERVAADVPLSTYAAFDLYSRLGGLVAQVTAGGESVARGRVEDLTLRDGGASLTALGPWRELSDAPYTALWSASGTPGWVPSSPSLNTSTLGNRTPEMYSIAVDQRIVISPTKGASYASGADVGAVAFRIPNGSSRGIVGMQFRLQVLLPSGWVLQVNRYADDSFSSFASVMSYTSAGSFNVRGYHLGPFTASGAVEIFIYNNTGGASAPAGETGDWYAIVDRLRVVTSTANRFSTTLTGLVFAGALVDLPVATTAGMYVGQEVVLASGASSSEIATVVGVFPGLNLISVDALANNYLAGVSVQSHQVFADEVVRDCLAATVALNGGGVLSSSPALIQSCARDLWNAAWEDTTPADIIADLAERGDGEERFETGVQGDGRLYFRPAGSEGRAWLVDASDLEVTQTLDGLVNSVYPRYQDAAGRTLRGTAQADAVSVGRYGLTRRGAVDADTTNAIVAAGVAATAVGQTADPVPRASITVRRIYAPGGVLAPLWLVRAGDTVTIRNLPPAAGASVNRIQTFRLAATEWDATGGTLRLTPESPQPDYESQAAAIQTAAEVAAQQSGTPASTPITVLPPQQTRRKNPPAQGGPYRE